MNVQTYVARERARESSGRFGVQEHSAPEMTLDPRVKIHQAHKSTRDLLDAHGLTDWKVTYDNGQRRLSQCHHRTKTISLSREHVLNGADERTLDSIRHDVAHALAGPEGGHGPVWTAAAARLGADVHRTHDDSEASVNENRRHVDYMRAVSRPFPKGQKIPRGTEVVILKGKDDLRGMRATILNNSMARYLVQTEDGQMLRATRDEFGRVPPVRLT